MAVNVKGADLRIVSRIEINQTWFAAVVSAVKISLQTVGAIVAATPEQ